MVDVLKYNAEGDAENLVLEATLEVAGILEETTEVVIHVTPASSSCSQLTVPFGHCRRLLSLPLHSRLSSKIGPVPSPKRAFLYVVSTPG